MARIGKAADSIFKPTIAKSGRTKVAQERASKPTPPEPKRHSEPYSKATVVLFDRQVAFLDRISSEIKATNGASVRRAEQIRAAIDAYEAAKISPETIFSEATLREILIERWKV